MLADRLHTLNLGTLPYIGALAAVLVPLVYMTTVKTVQPILPQLQNKRVCLVIAHPDDEAMFFAPTVLALTKPETGNHVKILCLSTGNADGLGETRKKELVKSGMLLGLRDEDDVFVLDDENFPDSMTITWPAEKIADLLSQASFDVLITFDQNGVSSHPNHKSLYHGARLFASRPVDGQTGHVDLYALTSINFFRKYASIGDVFTTLFLRACNNTGRLVFMTQLGNGVAWRAMTAAHASQMRWFRYGWIVFSRYMVINDLRLVDVDGA